MIAGFAITVVTVAPLYAEATQKSEQVSQLLFGERMIVLSRQKGGWLCVRCEWDHYEGWIKEGQTKKISEKDYKRKLKAVTATAQDHILLPDGRLHLSPGSSLFLIKGKKLPWNEQFLFKGKKVWLDKIVFEPSRLTELSKHFVGSPYLWGGRNIMGIDCSGFTQVVFKLFNYRLPRDAWQQAEKGSNVDFLQEARCGDLAFFDNEEGKIVHVGILLDHQTIIHATESAGQVVIDAIDNNGIISRQLKMRTHHLRLIKRYF